MQSTAIDPSYFFPLDLAVDSAEAEGPEISFPGFLLYTIRFDVVLRKCLSLVLSQRVGLVTALVLKLRRYETTTDLKFSSRAVDESEEV